MQFTTEPNARSKTVEFRGRFRPEKEGKQTLNLITIFTFFEWMHIWIPLRSKIDNFRPQWKNM